MTKHGLDNHFASFVNGFGVVSHHPFPHLLTDHLLAIGTDRAGFTYLSAATTLMIGAALTGCCFALINTLARFALCF